MYFIVFSKAFGCCCFLTTETHSAGNTTAILYIDQLHEPGKNGVYYLELWKYMHDIPKRIAAAS